MTDDSFADLLGRAHGGEVLGATLFEALAGAEPDPDHRRKLRACQLLEEQTRATLQDLAALTPETSARLDAAEQAILTQCRRAFP